MTIKEEVLEECGITGKETIYDVIVVSKYHISKLVRKAINRTTQKTLEKVEDKITKICDFYERYHVRDELLQVVKNLKHQELIEDLSRKIKKKAWESTKKKLKEAEKI